MASRGWIRFRDNSASLGIAETARSIPLSWFPLFKDFEWEDARPVEFELNQEDCLQRISEDLPFLISMFPKNSKTITKAVKRFMKRFDNSTNAIMKISLSELVPMSQYATFRNFFKSYSSCSNEAFLLIPGGTCKHPATGKLVVVPDRKLETTAEVMLYLARITPKEFSTAESNEFDMFIVGYLFDE